MNSFTFTLPAIVSIYVERNRMNARIKPSIKNVSTPLGGEWIVYCGRVRAYVTSAKAMRNEGRLDLLQGADAPHPL